MPGCDILPWTISNTMVFEPQQVEGSGLRDSESRTCSGPGLRDLESRTCSGHLEHDSLLSLNKLRDPDCRIWNPELVILLV